MKTFSLDFTKATYIPKEIRYGIEMCGKIAETPYPWDVELEIVGDNLIMKGGIGPGGGNQGTCVVTIPKGYAKEEYLFNIHTGEMFGDIFLSVRELEKILKDTGIKKKLVTKETSVDVWPE